MVMMRPPRRMFRARMEIEAFTLSLIAFQYANTASAASAQSISGAVTSWYNRKGRGKHVIINKHTRVQTHAHVQQHACDDNINKLAPNDVATEVLNDQRNIP